MDSPQSITIALPPDLLAKAQEAAARRRVTVDEFFADAVRRSVASDPEWESLLQWGRAHGKALGVESEEDVERMSDEWRQERRRASQ